MAVQVDQVTGVGTIINAGDYVDMVTGITGTDKVPTNIAPVPVDPRGSATPAPRGLAPETRPYNPTTVKTLVQGIQVLGTLLPPPTDNGTAASPEPGSTTTTLNGQQQIVILALKTQDAEVVKFAQIDGNISLVPAVDRRLPARRERQPVASPSPSPSPSWVPRPPLPPRRSRPARASSRRASRSAA